MNITVETASTIIFSSIEKSLPAMSKRGSVYNNDNNATSNGANRGRRRLPTNQRFRFDADCVSLTHNYEETK